MARFYFGHALASSTQRSYHSAQILYTDFCTNIAIAPIPILQSTLCLFVSHLASQGVAHKSIKCYLSAVRHLQIATIGSEPEINGMVTLGNVLQGNKRLQATLGLVTPRRRLPVTAAIIRTLRRSWEAQGVSFDRQMLWAAWCTCFHGFLRSGEATVPPLAGA